MLFKLQMTQNVNTTDNGNVLGFNCHTTLYVFASVLLAQGLNCTVYSINWQSYL